MDYRDAVLSCWSLREEAAQLARERGNTDPGLRAGVTSGAHLDPLADLVKAVIMDAGIPRIISTGDAIAWSCPDTSAPRRSGMWLSFMEASSWPPLSSRVFSVRSATT